MATNQDHIREYLEEWAGSKESPHFAVLLEGRWGCGKTHFVNSLADEESKFAGKRVIYISLFGISSAENLETQLFYSSASKSATLAHQGSSVIGSIVKGTLRVDLNGDGSPDATIDGKFGGLSKFIQTTFENIDNSILVLDDIERTDLPTSQLLGIVNRFVEHGDTRVILIANTDGFNDEKQKTNFQSFKEKVVGHSFALSGNPDEVISEFLSKNSNEVLKSQQEFISQLYHMSGYDNLRALRQFLYFYNQFSSKFDAELFENSEFSNNLIKAAFILFFEYKLDLSDESRELSLKDVWDVGQKEDDGSFDFGSYMGKGSETSIYYYDINAVQRGEDQPSYGKTMLKKYASYPLNTVLPRSIWHKILEGGIVEPEKLNEHARASLEIGWDYWPEWKRLWRFQSLDLNEKTEPQFWNDIASMQRKFAGGEYTDYKEFLQVVGVFLMLTKENVLTGTLADVVERSKACIDAHIYPNLCSEIVKEFRGPHFRFFGYEGLGYQESDSEEFKEIQQHLVKKIDDWEANWKSKDAGIELIDDLPDRMYDFLGNVVVSYSGEHRHMREPILTTIEPAIFVDKWLCMDRSNEIIFVDCFRDRYFVDFGDDGRSGDDLLLAEAPWWQDVQAKLEQRAEQIQSEYLKSPKDGINMHPRATQIRQLIEQINAQIMVPWEKLNSPSIADENDADVG